MAFLRYPPQGAVNTNYLVYLCDSWCTWNAQFQIGQANPSPADYSFECAFQTFGVNGSWIKRYDHIMQNANSTLYKYVYPLQVNSVYQFNNTANSPTSTLNTQLSCTVSGGGIGVPISSVTFGWGTSDRVGCVDGCGIFYVE
ncbi:MAG: hypothetical protein IPJ82_13415 [Lewinellaceae bacterium]|nr:hypothetical protein [Lewinellaceae bacterium]